MVSHEQSSGTSGAPSGQAPSVTEQAGTSKIYNPPEAQGDPKQQEAIDAAYKVLQ